MSAAPKTQEYFSSRWGLLLATLGMAVGTGNIWRFPRIAAQNGGGSFLIAWLIFLFLWSIPLLLATLGMAVGTRQRPMFPVPPARPRVARRRPPREEK